MGDLGGRYAAYTARLVDGVLASPGHTPGELRRAVLARAAQLSGSGSDASSPLSQRERGTRVEDATGASGETIPAAIVRVRDAVPLLRDFRHIGALAKLHPQAEVPFLFLISFRHTYWMCGPFLVVRRPLHE